jgi:CRP-like cAMP-binding protein
MQFHDRLIGKLQEHSTLGRADIAALRELPVQKRILAPNEDIVRQGQDPDLSVVVLEGMVARYHTLKGGRRQYLSFHIAGDMPDAQSLFLDVMDHSVCAMDRALVATVPHKALLRLFKERPEAGFAIWRETLIDASIFRQAITNNSAREIQPRLAHFFCEQFYRARQARLNSENMCNLPLTQTQLAETLASSLPSISRALIALRKTKTVELKNGRLEIKDWNKLTRLGDFNPAYLHLKKAASQ